MRKIILLSFAILSTAQILRGQDNGSFTLTVNHLAISVKDVNRSAEFYGSVLKFQEITNRSKFEGVSGFDLASP